MGSEIKLELFLEIDSLKVSVDTELRRKVVVEVILYQISTTRCIMAPISMHSCHVRCMQRVEDLGEEIWGSGVFDPYSKVAKNE